ncbi:MAG: TetR/AcrR family transcriptional regulator [Desulfohalobiaceae bacterium]|nr:TetR/AcrR family transcriptional regulator [Desulfohalobiaceae bacterium]
MENKRQKILDAAESIMSAKGRNATISEISAAADVTDAMVYYYFKNKEDLLYSVTRERLREALEKLEEQLQGIMDPANQISKLIWFQLYYHDTHRDYANLLLFECRSNKSFMAHSAYNLIKRWSAIGLKILKNGIADGSFRKDLSLPVVRDAVFGLVDMENIQSMAAGETPRANTDLEAILDLVQPMIRADIPEASSKEGRAVRILDAARTVFGGKGFQNATIQEISKSAEVSEGTIYEYFKNKEELLFSILKRQFRSNLDSMDELFEVRMPLRKLKRFVRYHFTIFLTQPVFLKIFLFDAIYNPRFYSSDAYPPFKHYLEGVYDILEAGKKDGSIRPEVNNRVFRNLFLGIFCHMSIRWLFTEKGGQDDKLKEIDDAVSMLCRAVAAKPNSRRIA